MNRTLLLARLEMKYAMLEWQSAFRLCIRIPKQIFFPAFALSDLSLQFIYEMFVDSFFKTHAEKMLMFKNKKRLHFKQSCQNLNWAF